MVISTKEVQPLLSYYPPRGKEASRFLSSAHTQFGYMRVPPHHAQRREPVCLNHGKGGGYTLVSFPECKGGKERGQALTFGGRGYPVLNRRLDRMFVVIRILHLLATIAQVSQDAHAILHYLVPDVRFLDGGSDHVEEGVHQTVALSQLLPRVFAGARHVSQHPGSVSEHGRPACLPARGARIPAAVRDYYVVHHHRHAVVDDGFLQVLKEGTLREIEVIIACDPSLP